MDDSENKLILDKEGVKVYYELSEFNNEHELEEKLVEMDLQEEVPENPVEDFFLMKSEIHLFLRISSMKKCKIRTPCFTRGPRKMHKEGPGLARERV